MHKFLLSLISFTAVANAASGDLTPIANLPKAAVSDFYISLTEFSSDGNRLYAIGDDDGLHRWVLGEGEAPEESLIEGFTFDPTDLDIVGDVLYVSDQKARAGIPAIRSVSTETHDVISDVYVAETFNCQIKNIQAIKATETRLYAVNLKNDQLCAWKSADGVLTELPWSGKALVPAGRSTAGMLFAEGDAIVLAIPNYGLVSYVTDDEGELVVGGELSAPDFSFGNIVGAVVDGGDMWVLDATNLKLVYLNMNAQGVMTFVEQRPVGASPHGLAVAEDRRSIYVLSAGGVETFDFDLQTGVMNKRGDTDSSLKGNFLAYNGVQDRAVVIGDDTGDARVLLARTPYTKAPTTSPTAAPTPSPTPSPTPAPTPSPTPIPTATPTPAPTKAPTREPTRAPPPTAAPEDQTKLEKPDSSSDENSGLLGMPVLFWIAVAVVGGIALLAAIICCLKRSGKSSPYGIAKQSSALSLLPSPLHRNRWSSCCFNFFS